jgi:hypothetical protein
MALQDAVAVVVWSKRDFRTFLEGTVPTPEVLSDLNWSDTKRNIAATVVRTLAADVGRYESIIDSLVAEICRMEEFPQLDSSDPTGGLATAAKAAVARLRTTATRVAAGRAASGIPSSFRLDPELGEGDYDKILEHIRSMAVVMERNPASFKSADEESIRDHLLVTLNGIFRGQATGETFNGAGKTDILIRVADRNIFIAECKFWGGQAKFNEAVDQLLGYLTWRDCKCALVVFNRNRDSVAVAERIHETMTARPEFRRTISHSADNGGRYALVKESEPGQEVIVSSLVFNVPVSPK